MEKRLLIGRRFFILGGFRNSWLYPYFFSAAALSGFVPSNYQVQCEFFVSRYNHI